MTVTARWFPAGGGPGYRPTVIDEKAEVVAEVRRGDLVESAHMVIWSRCTPTGTRGAAPVTHDGRVPRSSLKPVQAVAMLRAGLDLDGELLALACASHSGEPDTSTGSGGSWPAPG